LLLLWGLFVVYATLLPFRFSATGEQALERLRSVYEQPWGTVSRADAVSNVLLFIPWGFLLAIWRTERGEGWLTTGLLALFTGFALSASVELIQLYAPSRTTSLVDLATNTVGSTVGALIGWPFARWIWPRASRRIRQRVALRPITACAVATAAGLTVLGLVPFDVSLGLDALKAAIKRARLIPFGPPVSGFGEPAKPWSWAEELLMWTIPGALFALAAREAHQHRTRAIFSAAMAAGSLSSAIELIQVANPSREVDATSVVMALFGSTLGAVVVARSDPTDARRWIPLALLVWGAVALLRNWTPPDFAWPQPHVFNVTQLVPFWSYYARTDVGALADLADQVLLFVPLGVLLAARSRRRSIGQAALIGLAIGLVLEAGQLFLPVRTAELTDALLSAAGCAGGLALWRWGESIRDPTSSYGTVRYKIGPQAGLKK
jgi:glycopeptide antibiotics resistance protein